MDKLINYLEFRVQNYGTTKGTASVNSMYYQIGLFRVRVSDHMKYGEDALKENDFYFIIQPKDTYIFITSPKYNKDNKIYMRTVTYDEAHAFIKSLDDFARQYMQMTKWYLPGDWNREVEEETKPLDWQEFRALYMMNKSEADKLAIINRMESLVYGGPKKGNLDAKIGTAQDTYEKMTSSQYNAMIAKM